MRAVPLHLTRRFAAATSRSARPFCLYAPNQPLGSAISTPTNHPREDRQSSTTNNVVITTGTTNGTSISQHHRARIEQHTFSPTATAASRKKKPPHIPELYDAIVNPSSRRRRSPLSPNDKQPFDRQRNEQYGSPIDAPSDPYASPSATIDRLHPLADPPLRPEYNAKLLSRLRNALSSSSPNQATAVVNEINTTAGGTGRPTPEAILLVTEACILGDALNRAIEIQQTYLPSPHQSSSQLENADENCPARTARATLGLALCSRGAYAPALSVMGVPDVHAFARLQGQDLTDAVERLYLGRSAVAWGVVIRSIGRIGAPPKRAVQVAELATEAAVGVTDGLLHTMIDALRRAGMWAEAGALFDQAISKGLQPRESTLAAALIALTSRHARAEVDKSRIEKIVDMVEHPSLRFQTISLMALSAVGHISRTEQKFGDITEDMDDGIADEFCYSCMMAAYSNFIELMDNDIVEATRLKIYDDVNSKSDRLWAEYIKNYRLQRPKGARRQERETMLSKYLMVKSRCFRTEEAVQILEDLSKRREMYPYFEARAPHFAVVFGSLELACDVQRVERLMALMENMGIKHDLRSIAYCVGTYVGDGNLAKGLAFVRKHGPQAIAVGKLEGGFKEYFPRMLSRRLSMLRDALREAGTKKVPDLEGIIDGVDSLRSDDPFTGNRKNPR